MKKLNFGLRLIAVFMVLAFLWCVLFIFQFIYGEPSNANRNFIPDSAHAVVCIDGHLALKTIFSDLITFDDQELIDELSTTQVDNKRAELGINFNSEIYLFSIEKDNSTFNGALFNLIDEDAFRSSFEKFNSTNVEINGSVGLLLMNSTEGIPKQALNNLGKSIMQSENSVYEMSLSKDKVASSLVTVWTKDKNSKLARWNAVAVSLNKSNIFVKGNFYRGSQHLGEQFRQLVANPASFHISLTDFPEILTNEMLNELTETPKLTGISMNYNSVKIVQEPSFSLVPNADFILNFSDETRIQTFLNELKIDSATVDKTNSTFEYLETTFHYHQFSPVSLYIGRNPYDSNTVIASTDAIVLKGNPSIFTKIEGSDFIMRLMNIFPLYRAGKGLAHSINDVDVKVSKNSSNNYKIDGKIKFEEKRVASIELLLFLLQGGN